MLDTSIEAIYSAIRRDIIRGALPPRSRLRLESLRESYGVSVSMLREILNRLAGEDLVVSEGKRGFGVAPITQEEFRDLAALRELLEGHALRAAFVRGDLDWEGRVVGAWHKLGVIERAMLAGEHDRAEDWKRYDKEFHHELIAACGSAELVAAHGGIFDRYLRYQIIAMIFRGAPAVAEHRELRDRALARDTEGAIGILRRHIGACVEHTMATGALEAHPVPIPPRAEEATVAARTWKQVRGDILMGKLPPEAKLRLEQLRGAYGASVSTLREVLNRLATEGLVIAEGQRGFEVAPVSPGNLRELAELRYLVEGQALEDSFARGDVDWEARALAAYHRLSALEERMRAGDRAAATDWKRYDWEFHQALIDACGSRVLMQLHGAVFDKYLRYQAIALSFRGEIAACEHRALLNAALARDADAAREILKAHLMGGVEHALSSGCFGPPMPLNKS
ncbi:GntR family transcriptional regulator [Pararhodobacter sp. SW119]|uniref:GntR family transcriptional regulator n=1 Tax=Pararhodobacter sp. SW119 TaxID=2780075 RepID=UPI001FD869F8|nr:GntR family transcriptional regulator [Pararhodobacter sp. SW119]